MSNPRSRGTRAHSFAPPLHDSNNLPANDPSVKGRIIARADAGYAQLFYDTGTNWTELTGGGGVWFNVKEFGARGNGTTDDSTAISAAIAAANAVTTSTTAKGATVIFPPGLYLCNSQLTAPTSFVRLMGSGGIVWNTTSASASVLKAGFTDSALIDLGSGSSNISIECLGFVGGKTTTSGASLSHIAIKATSASVLFIYGCNFDGWGGPAVKIMGGIGKWVAYTQTTRCLMAYADLTDYAGTVQMAGDTHFASAGTEVNMYECNFNGPAFTIGSTHSSVGSGYAAAVYTNCAPNTFFKVVGAAAQTGIIIGPNVGTSPSFFTNCRAEFNQGHGWMINGNYCNFTACDAYDNNQDSTTPAYSGFHTLQVTDPPDNPRFTGNNLFTNCVVRSVTSGYAHLYAFLDNCAIGATPFHAADVYTSCRGSVDSTGRVYRITGSQVPVITGNNFTQAGTLNTTPSPDELTFDGEKGTIWRAAIASGAATLIKATNLLPGTVYTLYIVQNASAGTVTLDTTFAKTATFASPANSKHLTGNFYSDGTSLYQVGTWSGDM